MPIHASIPGRSPSSRSSQRAISIATTSAPAATWQRRLARTRSLRVAVFTCAGKRKAPGDPLRTQEPATVASFRTWRSSQRTVAGGPNWATIVWCAKKKAHLRGCALSGFHQTMQAERQRFFKNNYCKLGAAKDIG